MKSSLLLSVIFFLILYSCAAVFSKPMKNRSKYYEGGKEEVISFLSRESIDSDKKILRHGVLIRRPNAKGTVLICHGFSANKYDISFIHMMFKEYNSMAFDFRAHGQNPKGQVCTLGRNEAFDVLAAVKYIKNDPELKDKPLYAYGFSMGAVAAIIAQAQEENLFDALVLDCPYDSTDNLLDRGINTFKFNLFGYNIPIPGSSILRSYAYNTYLQSFLKTMLKVFADMNSDPIATEIHPVYPNEAIKYVKVPCFIIGCVNDDKAPVEAVRAIFDGAQGYTRLWLTQGRRHFDSIFYKLPEYFYRVKRFLEKCRDGSIKYKVEKKIVKDNVKSPIIQKVGEIINSK